MVSGYQEIGTEGHDLAPYTELFEHAKEFRECITLHAGFIPRTYAKTLMREGEEEALKAAKDKGFLPADITELVGTEDHFNMFDSMISGRDMHNKNLKPNDQFRGKFFKAQLIKDYAMAHYVNQLLK